MIIYHGTNLKNLRTILKEGIKPRGKKKSNWETGIGKSRKDLVYLTTCYAPYYAYCSVNEDGEEAVIIKLDIDISKINLYPDEEFLFNCCKKELSESKENPVKVYNKINPKKHGFIKTDTGEPVTWEDSLNYLGTVSTDFVPKEMIVGYHIQEKMEYTWNCDPAISPVNYKFVGPMYKKFIESLNFKKVEDFN